MPTCERVARGCATLRTPQNHKVEVLVWPSIAYGVTTNALWRLDQFF